jgi:hypothetical protein
MKLPGLLCLLCTATAVSAPVDPARQALEDAKHDRTAIIFDGQKPNSMVCDTALRKLADFHPVTRAKLF